MVFDLSGASAQCQRRPARPFSPQVERRIVLFLRDKCRPIIIQPVPTIDITDDELAAVTAAIRRAIETDRYPHAPRLDPLRSALTKLEPAPAPKPTSQPKAPPPAKADRRARP
jgi:hypothetical protein